MNIETEQANLRNISDWERQRQMTADAYAAVLTDLNRAAAAVPYDDGAGTRLGAEIVRLAGAARGNLRRVLDEPNPFVEPTQADADSMHRLAVAILSDAGRENLLHTTYARRAIPVRPTADRTAVAPSRSASTASRCPYRSGRWAWSTTSR
jgi:hypothetical protein